MDGQERGSAGQVLDDRSEPTQPIPVIRAGAAPPARRTTPRHAAADPPAVEDEQWHVPFPRLPRVLVAVAAVLGVLSIALPNIAPGVAFMAAEGSPVRLFFGVSQEMNLPTFFSVMLITATGLSHVLVGRLAGGQVGTAFLVTGGLLLMMAFDDFAALHERLKVLGALVAPEGFSSSGYLWVLPASLIAVVLMVAFWRLVSRLRGQARVYLLLGMAVVLFAALGLETMNGFLDRPGTDGMPLQIGTHVEEFTENLGMTLVLLGSLSILRTTRRRGGFALRVDDHSLGRTAPADLTR